MPETPQSEMIHGNGIIVKRAVSAMQVATKRHTQHRMNRDLDLLEISGQRVPHRYRQQGDVEIQNSGLSDDFGAEPRQSGVSN